MLFVFDFFNFQTVPLSCFVTVEPLVNLKLGTSQGSIKQRRADHFQLQEPEKTP